MKFLANVDLAGNELRTAVIEVRTSDPSPGRVGQVYFNSVSPGRLRVCTVAGSPGTWKDLLNGPIGSGDITDGSLVDADLSPAAGIQLTKLQTDPLARANHTGSQTASTISDFATARDQQRLDQHAAPTAAVVLNGQKITGLADPTAAQDAATKNYVDADSWKKPVRAAETGVDINTASPGSSIGGVSPLVAGDRVLLASQATTTQNGIWIWNGAAVAMTRATDADTAAKLPIGSRVAVLEGKFAGAIMRYLSGAFTAQGWDNHVGIANGTRISGDPLGIGMYVNGSWVLNLTESSLDIFGKKIFNVGDPTAAQDAATKNYVDTAVVGMDWKQSVKVATTGPLPNAPTYAAGDLTAGATGTMTIDGVGAFNVNDRILVKDQADATQNGIYFVVTVGAAGVAYKLRRATDADSWSDLVGAAVIVEQGTVNADTAWLFTVDNGGTLGTTAIAVTQFPGAGSIVAGSGLTRTGNQLDVGAGTGISVAADTVAIDTAVVGRKVRAQITGDGTATSFTVTHNWALAAPITTLVQVYDDATGTQVEADVTQGTNAVTIAFGTAPAVGVKYNVIVVG